MVNELKAFKFLVCYNIENFMEGWKSHIHIDQKIKIYMRNEVTKWK